VRNNTGQKKNGAMARTDRLPATKATATRRQPVNCDIDWENLPTQSVKRPTFDAKVAAHVLVDGGTVRITSCRRQTRRRSCHRSDGAGEF